MTALVLSLMLTASDVQVPAPAAAVDVHAAATERNETANTLIGTGIALSGISVLSLAASGILYSLFSQARVVCVTGPCPDHSQQQAWTAAGIALLTSAVTAAIGIPLLSRGIYLKRQRID